MATWTLADIRSEARHLTGRFSENELSTAKLDDDINKYYQLVFPAEVKLEEKYTEYNLLTTPNEPFYALPQSTYTNFVQPARIDNLTLNWYQDNATFLQNNPLQYSSFTPWTGDGSTTSFNTTLTGVPIYPGTLTITDDVETFQDTSTSWTASNIALTGDQGGTATINLDSGVITVNFATAPVNGQVITVKYILMQTGRPTAVLMFNNQLKFFPVPNTVYNFSVQAYQVVSPLVNSTDTPELNEWGPAIAMGAARMILRRSGEYEAYAQLTQLYHEQIDYVLTRTVETLSNTRAQPNF